MLIFCGLFWIIVNEKVIKMKRTSLSNIEVLLQEVKFHLEKYEVILLCIILFFFSGTESLIKEPQLPEDMRAGYEELEQNRANK